jgi:regulator of RNase E activity RraA
LNFGAVNYLALPLTAVLFKATIIGRNTSVSGQGCAFTVEGMIDNSANTAFVGSTITSRIASSNSSWNVDVVVDTANHGLAVVVTGTSGSTIHWSADVNL